MIELRRLAAFASVAILAAACGGGGAGSAGPTSAGSTSQPTQAASTNDTGSRAPSDAPGDTTTPTQGGGAGGADACSLITVDEVGSTLAKTGITADLTPGAFSYCMYRDGNGDILAASAYTARGGHASFDVWKASSGVQAVAGVGDEAVFDPSSATLFVIKGDALYSVAAGIGSDVEADRLAWETALAKIAAGRM